MTKNSIQSGLPIEKLLSAGETLVKVASNQNAWNISKKCGLT
jgi:hypothetical protein